MMPEEIMILTVGIVLSVLPIVLIVFWVRYRRTYHFSVHSHDVRLEIGTGGVFLYVDGTLEEQVSGQAMRFSTLRATIDGEEFRVHVTARGLRSQVEATHGGREIPCVGVTK